ncbi:MAG: hypothetical protein Q4C87_07220 [Actinomycetaceae bacterium]|nr:hypothetical protein [Actinomycetaceae bacterium]
MYAWIFRHLPGPLWLRIIQSLVLIAAAIFALFQWVFPWLQTYFDLGASSVG